MKNKKVVIGIVLALFMLVFFINGKNSDNKITENNTDNKITKNNSDNKIAENNKEEVDTSEEIPTNLNVEIKETMINENGKIKFDIETNLPDTAELAVTVSELRNGDYYGYSKAIVQDGKAQTEWFSNEGEALTNGEYTLSISMSMPATQSKEVQEAVGKDGEYLEGDLVVKDNDSCYVSMEKTISIENGASAEEKIKLNDKHKKIVAQFYNELMEEYNKQKVNYNDLEFGIFLADWNRRRNEAQSQMDEEDAIYDYGVAIRELISLQMELKYKLKGEPADENLIKETTQHIEEVINK